MIPITQQCLSRKKNNQLLHQSHNIYITQSESCGHQKLCVSIWHTFFGNNLLIFYIIKPTKGSLPNIVHLQSTHIFILTWCLPNKGGCEIRRWRTLVQLIEHQLNWATIKPEHFFPHSDDQLHWGRRCVENVTFKHMRDANYYYWVSFQINAGCVWVSFGCGFNFRVGDDSISVESNQNNVIKLCLTGPNELRGLVF